MAVHVDALHICVGKGFHAVSTWQIDKDKATGSSGAYNIASPFKSRTRVVTRPQSCQGYIQTHKPSL
jgi:hypothetical protein